MCLRPDSPLAAAPLVSVSVDGLLDVPLIGMRSGYVMPDRRPAPLPNARPSPLAPGQSSSDDAGTTTRNASDFRSMTTVAGCPSALRRAAHSSAGHDPRGPPAENRSNTFARIAAGTSNRVADNCRQKCACPRSVRSCPAVAYEALGRAGE